MSELKGAMSVDVTDAMTAAINDAMVRIKAVGISGTLIDSISKEEWKLWDASQEKALVSDPAGLDGSDFSDDEMPEMAA